MKRFLMIFSVFAVVVTAAMVVFAQVTPPDTLQDAIGLMPALMQAVIGGKWLLAVGGLLMVVTVVVRQYAIPKWNLSSKVLPWVTLGLSLIAGVGAYLFGGLDAKAAAIQMLVAGGLASQMWSLLGKQLTSIAMDALGKELAQSPPK
jgi:protein-S-isoprenylcysteine O-methyltransferase Ste14